MTDPSTDSIIQTKICAISGNEFSITQQDMDFYNKISPTFAGQKYNIPTPTLSPDERQRRRLAFRNERNLYRRKCDASGKDIISIYSPDTPYKVYDQKMRWSDSWGATEYGRDFDFSKTFTEQFGEMMKDVPMPALFNTISLCENSDYVNYTSPAKNCYLVIEGSGVENCYYARSLIDVDNVVDSLFIVNSNNIYGSVNIYNSSYMFYSQYCDHCSHSYLLIDCKNCAYCIECSGLTGKKYCIKNKQVSKEEFEKYLDTMIWDYTLLPKHTFESNIGSENIVGEYIFNSSCIIDSVDVNRSENCKFLKMVFDCKNSYDISHRGQGCELGYESENPGRGFFNAAFCYTSFDNIQYGYYLYCCVNSQHLFGCIGLRNKKYCIFNKQYTKEDYEKTVAKIIAHMQETGERGEFFHPSLSPFGYNKTVAQEYYPLNNPADSTENTEYWQAGYKRSSYEKPEPKVDKIIPGEKLPAAGCALINEQSPKFLQDIVKYACKCTVTGKLYRLIPQEIAFYIKHNIPLPRKHPDQRHLERLALRM